MPELPVTTFAKTIELALPVETFKFGETDHRCVNALDLYACLQIGREFRKWVAIKIKNNALMEGRDFVFRPEKFPAKVGVPKRFDLPGIMFKIPVALVLIAKTASPNVPKLRAYMLPFVDARNVLTKAAIAVTTTVSAPQPMPENIPEPETKPALDPIAESISKPVSKTKPKAESKPQPKPKSKPTPAVEVAAPETAKNQTTFKRVAVIEGSIGGQKCLCVSAQDLWLALGVKISLKDWFTNKAKEYDFIAGFDFDSFPHSTKESLAVNHLAVPDYILTLDTARHLSILEQTALGREIRNYFIGYQRAMLNAAQPVVVSIPAVQTTPRIEVKTVEKKVLLSSDLKILSDIEEAKQDRAWLLAMRFYGKVLLLSRQEKLSEDVALAYQARLAAQLSHRVQELGDVLLTEDSVAANISQLQAWEPSLEN